MTTEVNTYIALQDILAVRIECAACKSSSQMPVTAAEWDRFIKAMFRCPHCNAQWLESTNDRRYTDLCAFLAYLQSAREVATRLKGEGVKFALSLQIASAEDRVSGGDA